MYLTSLYRDYLKGLLLWVLRVLVYNKPFKSYCKHIAYYYHLSSIHRTVDHLCNNFWMACNRHYSYIFGPIYLWLFMGEDTLLSSEPQVRFFCKIKCLRFAYRIEFVVKLQLRNIWSTIKLQPFIWPNTATCLTRLRNNKGHNTRLQFWRKCPIIQTWLHVFLFVVLLVIFI